MDFCDLAPLRREMDRLNDSLLALLSRRAEVAQQVARVKSERGIPIFLPVREQEMLARLLANNPGPFSDEALARLFKAIFRASVDLMSNRQADNLLVSRQNRPEVVPAMIRKFSGSGSPVVIAGPCAVESEQQMEQSARFLSACGVKFLRGGAFKPRSSPYSFQGLGMRGLEILQRVARRHQMAVVSEVTDPRAVEEACRFADVLQIGARNMYNYDLLREVGRCSRAVLLKRGLSATVDEFLMAAEYILSAGNESLILCERGIRTFGRETRNTLDISAIPLLKQKTWLPIIVDVSHAAGRRDILLPLARASLAAGADGVMVEVHPSPATALSDSHQQLDFEQFHRFLAGCGLIAHPEMHPQDKSEHESGVRL